MSEIETEIGESGTKNVVLDIPGQLECYANMSTVSISAEEAVIHFGVRKQTIPNESNGVVKIYVSLPHIKRIAFALNQIIQRFEEITGEEINPDPAQMLADKIKKSEKI